MDKATSTEIITTYFKAVCDAYRLGNVESSYNAPIMALFTDIGCAARDLSGERKGQTGENIDIKLWHSEEEVTETEPFAGVEVKKVGGIDKRALSQIKIEADRYGNAILTDNLEWRFWRAGDTEMYTGLRIMELVNDKLVLREDNVELFISLVEDFLLRDPAQIKSSTKLAEYMAMHARTIRSIISGILKDDGNGQPLVTDSQKRLPMFIELYGLYSRIKSDLRPLMNTREFADMYAQTIVYGLFIARYNDTTPDSFDRYEAIKYLQEESELLKQFFMHIAGTGRKHPTLEGVIEKLCSLYRICNISALLERDEKKDTIIHFYEEFLTFYDPASFDKIYIVNLHGSANKKETAPDGSRDENIFDIMQGVSLFIGVKKTKKTDWAKVYYTDIWGTRETKLEALAKGDLTFTLLKLDHKMAYFIPFGNSDKDAYDKGVSIAELFPISVTGIVSGNDSVAIAPTKAELIRRMDIVKHATEEKDIFNLWGRFSRGQTAEKIQNDVLSEGKITQISFRPFDSRWTYYSGNSCGWVLWPREKSTMGHLLAEPTSPIGANIGLVFCKTSRNFFSPFVSRNIIAHRLFSAMCEITYIAPLYLRSESELTGESWTANLNDDAFNKLTQYLPTKPTPIEVFDYVYGILHDPVYCEKYEQYLCRDFPRVPVINEPEEERTDGTFFVSEDLYREYVVTGERLRKLHLMQIKVPAELMLDPNTPDDMEIGAVKYKNGVLQLNANKHITGISQDVWQYQIGGHQVLDKWFKEHKGETLTIDSFTHIENVVGLLAETINLREHMRSLHKQI